MKYQNWEISELFRNFMHEIWEFLHNEQLKYNLDNFGLVPQSTIVWIHEYRSKGLELDHL